MDSETVHGTVRSGVTSVPEAGPLFWKSVDAGWKRQKHGDGLPVLHPGQTALLQIVGGDKLIIPFC